MMRYSKKRINYLERERIVSILLLVCAFYFLFVLVIIASTIKEEQQGKTKN